MALTKADKAWLRTMLRAEIKSLLEDMLAGQMDAAGGYDGKTDVTEDEWAEEGKRRIGFASLPATGRTPNDVT